MGPTPLTVAIFTVGFDDFANAASAPTPKTPSASAAQQTMPNHPRRCEWDLDAAMWVPLVGGSPHSSTSASPVRIAPRALSVGHDCGGHGLTPGGVRHGGTRGPVRTR